MSTEQFFVEIKMDDNTFPDNYPTLDNIQSVFDEKAVEMDGSNLYKYWHRSSVSDCRYNPGWMFSSKLDASLFIAWVMESQEWKSTLKFLNAEITIL